LTSKPTPSGPKTRLNARAQEKISAFDALGCRFQDGLQSIGQCLLKSETPAVSEELKQLRDIATSTNQLLVESKTQTAQILKTQQMIVQPLGNFCQMKGK
jgi:hypothetical protein